MNHPRWEACRRARAAAGGRAGQHGQALIEFTLFFLIIMFLLAGVVDIGGLLSAHVAEEYAARMGARTGSTMGSASNADCAIIGAVHAALATQPNITLTQLVIYQATNTVNGQYTGTQSAEVYQGAVDCVNNTIVNAQTGKAQAPVTDTWPSSSRVMTAYTEDSLGVQLTFTYQFQFSLLGSTYTGADTAVCPLNPASIT